MNWIAWHHEYPSNDERSARLDLMRRFIDESLRAAAPGRVVLVSICAGDSRDVLTVLPAHPRRADVAAWLLESEEALTREAAQRIDALGLAPAVQARAVDATWLPAYADIPPADVCVLAGVFGNLEPAESFRLIRHLKHICAPRAAVAWTRNLTGHEGSRHAAQLRACFAENAFSEQAYLQTPAARYGVGLMRFEGQTEPTPASERFFVFGRRK